MISDSTNIELPANRPMVTVVTVVFNDVHNIEKTILSVLNLEYKPLEYIIVDGASTDGTTDIIRKYNDRIKRWISEPDKGIYDAMNKGIAMATGDWINFMNSGDRFASPGSLTFFEEAPQADVVYGRARIEYPSFSREWKNSPISEMWKGMAFCHQASFVRTSLMKEYNFDDKYRISADFNFFYLISQKGGRFLYVDKLICDYDFKAGLSKNAAVRSTVERKNIVLRSGFNLHRWAYYNLLIGYIKAVSIIKSTIGKDNVEWLTRKLKA